MLKESEISYRNKLVITKICKSIKERRVIEVNHHSR